MSETRNIAFILLFTLLHIFFCAMMSKTIYNWVPSIKKQILYYVIVWCLPLIGIVAVNKLANLGWFKTHSKKGGDAVISGGLLEMDSVFNPGTRHVIELREQEHVEIREGGEDDNRKKHKKTGEQNEDSDSQQ